MSRLTSLAVFLLVVVLAAALSGQFVGGEWFQIMHQPSWNPSVSVMTVIWAVMYVLMGVSAWLVWDTERSYVSVALTLWVCQLLLGVGWSWLYFGLHRVGWAMAIMGLWFVAAVVVVNAFRFVKMEASALMVPVAVWLMFSWALNFVQWNLNGGGIG